MSVKQEILALLEAGKGSYISGEELAERLSVSRTAVWKAIEELRKDHYPITAVTRRGYCLSTHSDLLSAQGILPYLKHREIADHLFTYPVCDSTNLAAKKMAVEGAPHGTVVAAEAQTAGHGRLGRSFFSPAGSGIYLSMVLRPQSPSTQAVLITTAASVAVCRAILRVTGKQPRIKWVNDLYLAGKKICGISAEGIADMTTGAIGTVILGIGVNFTVPHEQLPPELQEIVGYLYEEEAPAITKNQLIATIVDQVLDLMDELPSREFLDDYRKWSLVLGRRIRVLPLKPGVPAEKTAAEPEIPGVCDTGTAREIDPDGALIVEMDDGSVQTLNTGEISIRRLP